MKNREIDELEQLGVLDSNGEHSVDNWLIWDLSAGYYVSDTFTVRARIDNLFDKQPTKLYGSSRGFDSINHNAYGARYSLSITYQF